MRSDNENVQERRQFNAALVWALLGCGGWAGLASPAHALSLSEGDAAAGVRAALEKGAASAVALLGRNDGFLANPRARIPLPGVLKDAAKLLKVAGQQRRVDELVTAMNRAAEAAVPAGKTVLVDAVRALTVTDALAIVRGGDNSVTNFFASKTRSPLTDQFLPIVTQATEKVQLAERYNTLAAKATSLGLIKGDNTNVQQHVTAKSLDALFLFIGDEEKKLRANPAQAGTALLRRVFGG
jgi:Protein of unknown function (DUF4197)